MPITADSRTMFSLIVLTLVLLNSSFLISAGSSISCESMENNLSCEDGKTIHIHSANYGRTDSTTCSTGRPACQLAKNYCYALNSQTIVANGCEGKGHCSILATNSVFSDPCVGTYKYLSISYSCLRSEIRSSISCESVENNLSCEDGKTIRIHSANYGRTDSTTCSTGRPASQLAKNDCYALNSKTIVANGCEGKGRCSILAANSVFSDPCVGTYKYLTISYSCV